MQAYCLKCRTKREMKNAQQVAGYLADHPKIKQVHYLGHLTEEDPQFEIYRKQCLAPGGIIAFELHGGEKEAFCLLNSLKLIQLAVSLGGTESLAEHPASMTHSELDPAEREEMGVTEDVVRLSIGVENPDDLIADLEQALAAV